MATIKNPPKPKWKGLYNGFWAMNGNEPLDKLMYALSGLAVLSQPVKTLIEGGVVAILQASNQYAKASDRIPYLNSVRKDIMDNLNAYNIFSTSFLNMVNKGLVDGQAWEQQNRKRWDKENP